MIRRCIWYISPAMQFDITQGTYIIYINLSTLASSISFIYTLTIVDIWWGVYYWYASILMVTSYIYTMYIYLYKIVMGIYIYMGIYIIYIITYIILLIHTNKPCYILYLTITSMLPDLVFQCQQIMLWLAHVWHN